MQLIIYLHKFLKTHSLKKVNFCTQMPKDTFQMNKLIAMRQKRKLKMLQLANSNVRIKILGSGAHGAPRSIFVSTDHMNYIFNCGEGTQRLAHEHHCKLTKLGNIFVTRASWTNTGGIIGMLLTMQECGLPEVNIFSPHGVQQLVGAVKPFVTLQNLQILYASMNESEPYKDNVMTVWFVPITMASPNSNGSSSKLATETQYSVNTSGKRVINETAEAGGNYVKGKKSKVNVDVMCYICKVHPKRGKLSVEKCIDVGLEPGPLFKLLKDGESVATKSGKVINSKDVCTPDGPKCTFAVIECPEEGYLDSLTNHTSFSKYMQPTSTQEQEEEEEYFYMFHFTPEKILNHPQYEKWMDSFPPNTQHIILNGENKCMGSEAVFKNQYLLHILHREIFPLLNEDCFKKDKETKNPNIYRARTMQEFQLQPFIKHTTDNQIYPKPKEYIEEVFEINEFGDALVTLEQNINKKTAELALTDKSEYPRILMLGTGSSVPNKIRNTSGILLRIDETNSIVLDCGEGTLGQLIRFFGKSNVGSILRTIKAVYISHIHADHHLGVIGLLQERKKYTNDRLFLLGPCLLITWLNIYDTEYERISYLFTFVDNGDLYTKNHKLPQSLENVLYGILNVKDISTTCVKHCKFAYGVAITLKDGTKIVYSGDTMPSSNLIDLGNNCDLLIHEATMDDTLVELARLKFHSTISEAINVGRSMNAKFTLLTHFSQRYSKITMISEEENVGLSYDFMYISLSQLPLLPFFYPCLKLVFNEYYKALETRVTARKIKIA
ncbi:ribonuclease Z, mitochondrial-like [Hylaeus volcanicus]|uniref:ribonuclease Z, mitochondrial-like n=1 Tax=Hylaeus volcanicus TaxID=313075 RepID=UPI0023B86AE0|nr:ribonuclease Z, mitochondrial-like [Hylaeus volcanicus]XP_053984928.1 ribonuclease Z, mitochondrial-like [Hylaeus volcanicus]XP_053984929.1 ribonuclease Z, mitochondrial-like [Hylaeus volcanicus]XP_053984930.1 ribonuclease Z, mitochondrial-like [Hylaeus volcanicus]XP_053984931.1 ribonuclease Z, mitochondrial-like [Hylaeus volcanicus]XP_053984932.1 ribonuclease Z, mitochondrial-like [Hylaeus volcanicus]XP_053984933.1 ribonuclease Z, mitochondrial-like [Hylaeus volcanicus]